MLSLNLASLLQTQNIQQFPWHPRRQPEYGVKVNVLGMDADSRQATLVVEWLVYRVEDGKALQRRLEDYSRPLSGTEPGAGQIAASYSELLYLLSEDIATALEQLAQVEPVS